MKLNARLLAALHRLDESGKVILGERTVAHRGDACHACLPIGQDDASARSYVTCSARHLPVRDMRQYVTLLSLRSVTVTPDGELFRPYNVNGPPKRTETESGDAAEPATERGEKLADRSDVAPRNDVARHVAGRVET